MGHRAVAPTWFHCCRLLASSGWVLGYLLSCLPGNPASISLLLPSDHCHLPLRWGPGCRGGGGLVDRVCPVAYMSRAWQWPPTVGWSRLSPIPDPGTSWHRVSHTFEGARCQGLRWWCGQRRCLAPARPAGGRGNQQLPGPVHTPPKSTAGLGSLEQQRWPTRDPHAQRCAPSACTAPGGPLFSFRPSGICPVSISSSRARGHPRTSQAVRSVCSQGSRTRGECSDPCIQN